MPRGGKRPGAGRPKGSTTRVVPAPTKGISTNGSGATAQEKAELAAQIRREYGAFAIRAIADVMQDPNETGSTRIKAAGMLLDRGYGLPQQGHEYAVWPPPPPTAEEQAHKEELDRINRESAISIAKQFVF